MERTPHCLIVEDDREIGGLLSRFLAKHGFRVSMVQDGKAMRRVLSESGIDIVVLDVMLPGEGGLELCRRLRLESNIPVILLTALGEETDRIIGLEMGADDYVAKPFNQRELLARMRAVMRRASSRRMISATRSTISKGEGGGAWRGANTTASDAVRS